MKITQLRNRNYVRCSVLDSARRIATRIPSRDFVPWRFSDAGCPSVWMASFFPGLQKTCTEGDVGTSQNGTHAALAGDGGGS